MKGVTPALRYARALLEVARETGRVSEVEEDLATVEEIVQDAPAIRRFCTLPRQTLDSRVQFVKLVFGKHVSELTQRTLHVIAINDRLGVIPHLARGFKRLRREESGVTQVVLESASKPEDRLKAQIIAKMELKLGRDVELVTRRNPSLLGGFRLFWDDRLLDNSARARIHALRRQLSQTGNRPVRLRGQ